MDKPVQFISATLGAFIGFLFGEITGMFTALIAVVIIDYITGIIKAIVNHELSSEIGFKGIAKKVMIFCIVSLAHLLDQYVLGRGAVCMSAATLFYISNEGVSILENAIEIGVPFPQKIKDILLQITDNEEEIR